MMNSTKYLRQQLKEHNSKYRINFSPDAEEILKKAKRGGNTHARRLDELPSHIDGRDKAICLYDYAGLILKAKEIEVHG